MTLSKFVFGVQRRSMPIRMWLFLSPKLQKSTLLDIRKNNPINNLNFWILKALDLCNLLTLQNTPTLDYCIIWREEPSFKKRIFEPVKHFLPLVNFKMVLGAHRFLQPLGGKNFFPPKISEAWRSKKQPGQVYSLVWLAQLTLPSSVRLIIPSPGMSSLGNCLTDRL